MRTLRAWLMQPGTYSSELPEFVAGAAPVEDTRVLAHPGKDCALMPIAMVAVVPPESRELARVAAEHESGHIGCVDYFVRWAILHPTAANPRALARLDLRCGGPSIFEARLLFDVASHNTSLWAAAHAGWVSLASPHRLPATSTIMRTPAELPSSLSVDVPASPLADALRKLHIPDPFTRAAATRSKHLGRSVRTKLATSDVRV